MVQRNSNWRRVVGLLCLCAAATGLGFDFGPGARLTMSGFQTKGRHDDGGVAWTLNGGKATVKGVLVEMEKVRLTFLFRDGEAVLITSPRCSFNQTTEAGQSDAPIHVEGKTIRLDGVGYDIWTEKQKLRVRSQVRMVIRRAGGVLEKVRVLAPQTGPGE